MRPSHWLLVGGPAHGEVHEVFFSTKLYWDHKGRQYLYTPQVHNDANGKSYILGMWQPNPDELSFLLNSRQVPPIVWENSVTEEEPKRLE